MREIVIKNPTSYGTVEEFQNIVGKEILPENIINVKIYYDTTKGLPNYDCENKDYPVIMETDMDINIYLFSLTAGYGGAGPNDLLKVLKIAGFQIDSNKILQNRKIVKLNLFK